MDKGLFVFPTLFVAFWGWLRNKVGWGISKTNQAASNTTVPDLGRDRKLASVHAKRAMEEG
jgi:hypothetical protein